MRSEAARPVQCRDGLPELQCAGTADSQDCQTVLARLVKSFGEQTHKDQKLLQANQTQTRNDLDAISKGCSLIMEGQISFFFDRISGQSGRRQIAQLGIAQATLNESGNIGACYVGSQR